MDDRAADVPFRNLHAGGATYEQAEGVWVARTAKQWGWSAAPLNNPHSRPPKQ